MPEFPIKFGRYELLERLAIGGMAELFIASAAGEHGFAKRLVIKRLLPQLASDELYTAMFIDEAKLTARLVHPKIAQTHELGRVGEHLFIAMEFVDGIDVLALLRELAQRKERLEPRFAVWIAHEVLDALEYAHTLTTDEGRPMLVVHRDISPSNVLLSSRGDIKLVDFGIARAKDPDRAHKSKSGTLKGKYGYMSPEQVAEVPIDHRSDVFSVGVLLAEMVTGRRLFAAANELDVLIMVRDARLTRLDKFGGDIDPALDRIMRQALQKHPEERWKTAGVFRDALGEWMYEHRHRVTPPMVAALVASMRGAVEERRSEQLKADTVNTAVLDAEGRNNEVQRSVDLDSTPIISLSYDELVAESAVPDKAAPTPIGKELSEGVDIEFNLLPTPPPPDAPGAFGSPRSAPTENTPKPVLTSPALIKRSTTYSSRPTGKKSEPIPKKGTSDPGLGPARRSDRMPVISTLDVPPRPPAAARAPTAPLKALGGNSDTADPASKFPSIEAAIESLMPLGPDPAALDFDDSEVEPHGRSAAIQVPPPEDVARRRPPTPPKVGDIADQPDDQGDFAETPALKLMYRLLIGNSTGLLLVQIGGVRKEIYLRDGQPEFVSSNVASELFGNYLVTKGVLSDGELAMALAMIPHYGGKLGDTLVGLGLLKPLEVFRHLTRQVRTKLIDVCSWSKGTYAWFGGRENKREAFPLDLNIYEVLGAGALAVSDDLVDEWLSAQRSQKLKPVRNRKISLERFELSGLAELDSKLDGRSTVGDLCEQHKDRDERMRAARLLFLLWACELVRA